MGRMKQKTPDADRSPQGEKKILSGRMKQKLANGRHRKVLFSDEKYFLLNQPLNSQNDRIYVRSGDFKDIEESAVGRPKFPQKVMVWIGCGYGVKSKVIFFHSNRSVNNQSYVQDVLLPEVVPLCGRNGLIFQQDGAPAHTAKQTLKFLKDNAVQFLAPDEWPPNSPDLNPLDCCIRGALDQEVYRKPVATLQALKRRIRSAWDRFNFSTLNSCIDRFPTRLRRCYEANGGYFE